MEVKPPPPLSPRSSPPRPSRTRNKSEELLCNQDTEHRPAVPEIIATKYTHAKSKKIVVQVPKKKHNVTVVVNSKSKGLLHRCPSESKD